MVFSQNDVWETNAEFPYQGCVTTQICLVLLILVGACGKFASANEKHYPNLGSDAMCLFLTCQFAGKPMVALQHLKLNSPVQIKSLFNYPSLSLLQIGDLLSPCYVLFLAY